MDEQQMQKQMMEVYARLGKESVAGSIDGIVTVVMNGQQQVVAIKFDENLVEPKIAALLEQALLDAFAQAQKQALALAQKYMAANEPIITKPKK